MRIENFTGCEKSERFYGGNAGQKLGVMLDGEFWFLKFPKSTKGFRPPVVSYTTSPLSEYIASQIYNKLAIPVHETLLGIYGEKTVVACKDFCVDGKLLIDFKSIANIYIDDEPNAEALYSLFSTNSHELDLQAIIGLYDINPILQKVIGAKNRFWDMFVIDALLGNNDRNATNWGFLQESKGSYSLAPVFDNGGAFNNYMTDAQMEKILNDETRLRQSAITSKKCIFSIDGTALNPFEYLRYTSSTDCQNAVLRVVPRLTQDVLEKTIDDIPCTIDDREIISETRKTFYKESMLIRYKEVLYPLQQRFERSRRIEAER